MSEESAAPAIRAWLVSRSGPTAGLVHEVVDGSTTVGRGSDNDLVIQGADVANVSQQHLVIRREGNSFRICDLGSTNGTSLNGEAITEADLHAPSTIRLGSQGPEFSFTTIDPGTQPSPAPDGARLPASPTAEKKVNVFGTYEGLLSRAVERARHARLRGMSDQTLTIMREALEKALHRTNRRFQWLTGVLTAGLIAVAAGGAWKVYTLDREKGDIDRHIHQVEEQLRKTTGDLEASDRLLTELSSYQSKAEKLEQSPFYRYSPHEPEDFLVREIRALMAEFGAEAYSVPPDFVERVAHYIEQDQGPNRPLVAHVLNNAASQVKIVRQLFQEEQLPPDLAYIPIVESALAPGESSAAGARGPWQLTPGTARAFGLRVDKQVDERTDLVKSTRASCRFLRDLILDFGTGSSVMLALAAYNLGPSKVKQAVMNTVKDPIKQRNFWYLYRVNALPKETREYVPRVVAAMIIGRNPRRYGFGDSASTH